jgi:transposase
MQIKKVITPVIRYSETFKIKLVTELEREGVSVAGLKAKYGIKGCGTVEGWVRQYGNGSRGKVIRVETPEEINETKRLKQRVKLLEKLLADANIKLMLEEGYTQIACERAGITDVEGFKKKHPGGRPT